MKRFAFSLVAAATCLLAQAEVTVAGPWVRATVAQQKATGAFMQLKASQDTRLVSAQSSVAGITEVHEMSMEGGVMKMRAVPGLALPAGKAVDLKPGGYHVMLMDLKAQVKEGDSVPLTLVFEGTDGKRESMDLTLPARLAAPHAGHGAMKH
jgi:copper(I)-binding protein